MADLAAGLSAASPVDGKAWEVAVVVGPDGVVSGTVRPEAGDLPPGLTLGQILHPAPPTVRPGMARADLAASMDRSGQSHVLVTTAGGVLLGLIRREDLDPDA